MSLTLTQHLIRMLIKKHLNLKHHLLFNIQSCYLIRKINDKNNNDFVRFQHKKALVFKQEPKNQTGQYNIQGHNNG